MLDNTFLEYFYNKGLGYPKFDKKSNKPYYEFTIHDFSLICDTENVFNGEYGGLVLGKPHSEGGVHLVSFIPNTNSYIYVAEMEGGEFLSQRLNKNSYIMNKYKEINERIPFDNANNEIITEVPINCNIINTENKKNSIILITHSDHFIVKRLSTKAYINELIELNKFET